jgi:arylsulfatase I/J
MRCIPFFTFAAAGVAVSGVKPPDILYILLDDFGWADAGWHRALNYTDVQTPHMNALVKEGVELDRHYAFKYCSPTRSAIQSGRNPIHVNVLNLGGHLYNPKDKVSGYQEMPRNMTGLAEHLADAGYETHYYGKWHAGSATPQHSPRGRGYQKSLHYFGGANDYWTSKHFEPCRGMDGAWHKIRDLWDTDGPASGLVNPWSCSQDHQKGCIYEDQLFLDRVQSAIRHRDPKTPLFVFWAPHIVHEPLQIPNDALNRFSFIDEPHRQHYHAMVYWIDEAIGAVTAELKRGGTWDNTLVIVHADNGGPIYTHAAGGNNYPLKGGKRSNWEGGIRVNAFVAGGFLPPEVRGTKQEGLMAAWDWYVTLARLVGVDPTDRKAEAAGLPPVDGYNMWPLISGKVTQSPRSELAIGDPNSTNPHILSATRVGGLIQGRYKLIVGWLESSGWTGPVFPNSTSDWDPSSEWQFCSRSPANGCLFDIVSDPGEHTSLAAQEPELFQRMLARMAELEKSAFSPDRGTEDPLACKRFLDRYGGFYGPWVDIGEDQSAPASSSIEELHV